MNQFGIRLETSWKRLDKSLVHGKKFFTPK